MEIFKTYYQNANPEKAQAMAAYMKNQFPFLGIQSPGRKEINDRYFKQLKGARSFDWEFVFQSMKMPEREFTYLATEYIYRFRNLIEPSSFINIERAALIKPWWDSIDSIAPSVGFLCKKYPILLRDFIEKWIYADNIWLKRISIIFQLKYKNETNLEILSQSILENKNSNEFFVNKAIGWALREYSKSDPKWVLDFVKHNSLSKLSENEALKWINRL
jgi:3-methyladenine DNA glycosylase AlkD